MTTNNTISVRAQPAHVAPTPSLGVSPLPFDVSTTAMFYSTTVAIVVDVPMWCTERHIDSTLVEYNFDVPKLMSTTITTFGT